MASDGEFKVHSPGETIEALTKEAEALKAKLEEERQKLNDVACKKDNYKFLHYKFLYGS
jgi:predicted phage tail protein